MLAEIILDSATTAHRLVRNHCEQPQLQNLDFSEIHPQVACHQVGHDVETAIGLDAIRCGPSEVYRAASSSPASTDRCQLETEMSGAGTRGHSRPQATLPGDADDLRYC